jgi:subfamily B ATP-binding cassette protein HlyB/CyaB
LLKNFAGARGRVWSRGRCGQAPGIWDGGVILLARRLGRAGIDPRSFGLRWLIGSIWRCRRPLAHVLIASLFIPCFALITPLLVMIDKVLGHKALSTLTVIVAGLAIIAIFGFRNSSRFLP